MILVQQILKGIDDDRALDGHVATASPLRDLVEQYNKFAFHNDHLPKINALSTGSQLKIAVSKADPEFQVALLHKYSVATRTLDTPNEYSEDPAKAEIRKMRMFLFQACVVLLAVITCVMIGITITVAAKNGEVPDGGVLSTLVSTAGEILKTILTTPAK